MNAQRKFERFCRLFDSKVSKDEKTGCWNWTASVRPGTHPYGKIAFEHNGQKFQLAHRFSYFRHNGELAETTKVLHSCDNPRCQNPDHLFTGTQQDNVADATAKGRMKGQPGNRHNAKISPAQVAEIKLAKGRYKPIAAKYGITAGMVGLIKRGKAWRSTSTTNN